MVSDEYVKRIEQLENLVESHEQQIKQYKDVQEIQNLHTNYAYWLCTREWEKIVDSFTDDAVVILHRRGRFEGKAEITEIFKKIVQNNRGKGRDGHLALQPIINVEGDTATAQWLMYIMMLDPKGEYQNTWMHGRHDVEYIRLKGSWKMSYMLFTAPWPREAWTHPTLEQLKKYEEIKANSKHIYSE